MMSRIAVGLSSLVIAAILAVPIGAQPSTSPSRDLCARPPKKAQGTTSGVAKDRQKDQAAKSRAETAPDVEAAKRRDGTRVKKEAQDDSGKAKAKREAQDNSGKAQAKKSPAHARAKPPKPDCP